MTRRRVKIQKVVSGRYEPGTKPELWDKRHHGLETIITTENEEITLFSTGGQSTPQPGWEILLMDEDQAAGPAEDKTPPSVCWTLYGVPRAS